jgi:hypothetical protein
MVSSDDWLMGNTKSNTPKHRWLFQPNLKENVTPKLIGSHHICICALGCHCWVCLQHLFFQPLWSYCAWFWLKTDYRRPTAAPIWTKKSTHHILRTRKMGHCKPSEGHECPWDHHSLFALNTICRQTGTQSGYQQSSIHRNYISQKEEHINLKKVGQVHAPITK